jgi:predicted Mrr-cat superfamily restriction endonuclease
MPENPTPEQLLAFSRRQTEIEEIADQTIRFMTSNNLSKEKQILHANRQSNQSYVTGEEEDVSFISANDSQSDLTIDIGGVCYRKTDESEFRRALIQNFIKEGNLKPIVNHRPTVSSNSTSNYLRGPLIPKTATHIPKMSHSEIDKASQLKDSETGSPAFAFRVKE